jgi:hypothetical protein
MIVWKKVITVTQASNTLERVICEKCRCEYYYPKTRLGQGKGAAAFGIGQEKALSTAAESASSDLAGRLSQEADLVPCPKCHWINESLIKGFRRTMRRGSSPIANALAGTIIGASTLAAIWKWGIRDPWWLVPGLLFGGWGLGIAILILESMTRSIARITLNPNRYYPAEPIVPVGTPPAYFFDAQEQTYRLAKPISLEATADEYLTFQVGRDPLPTCCLTCLTEEKVTDTYPIKWKSNSELKFPQCEGCSARRLVWQSLIALAVIAPIGWISYTIFQQDPNLWYWLGGIVGGGSYAIGLLLGWLFKPLKYRIVDTARGVLKLKFSNQRYQQKVAQLQANQLGT